MNQTLCHFVCLGAIQFLNIPTSPTSLEEHLCDKNSYVANMGRTTKMIEYRILYNPGVVKDSDGASSFLARILPVAETDRTKTISVKIPKIVCRDHLAVDTRIMVSPKDLSRKNKSGDTFLLSTVEVLEEIETDDDVAEDRKRKREEKSAVIHSVKRERITENQEVENPVVELKDVPLSQVQVNLRLVYQGISVSTPETPTKKPHYRLFFVENPSRFRISMIVFEEDFPLATARAELSSGATYVARNVVVQEPYYGQRTLKYSKSAHTSFVLEGDYDCDCECVPIAEVTEGLQKLKEESLVSVVGVVISKGPLGWSRGGTCVLIGSAAEETAIRVVSFSSTNDPLAQIRVGEAAVFFDLKENSFKGARGLIALRTSVVAKDHPRARPHLDWWENATPLQRGTSFSLKTIEGVRLMKDVLFEEDFTNYHWVFGILVELRNMDVDPSLPIGLFSGVDGNDFEVPLPKDRMEEFLGNPENFEDAMQALTCSRVNLLLRFSHGKIALEHFAITTQQ